MDTELSEADMEALNKLIDDVEKLNKRMQRFEESRRLQAESRANRLDRMLDVLEQKVRRSQPGPLCEDLSTRPENPSQVSIPEVAAGGLDDPCDVEMEPIDSETSSQHLGVNYSSKSNNLIKSELIVAASCEEVLKCDLVVDEDPKEDHDSLKVDESIDVTNKSDSAVATGIFDLCLDISTIDSTQAEVISVHSSSMIALSKKEIKNEKDGLEFGNTVYLQSRYSSQPLKHTPIDFKPVLVLKIDDKRHNSKEFEFGTIISRSLNFCTETVRRNACEIFPFFLPPAKPPDERLSLLQVYSIWCYIKCWDLALSSIQEKELLVWIATRTCASIFMMEHEALLSCYHMLCLLAGATKFRWPKMEAKKKIEIEYIEVFDKQVIMHLPMLPCEQFYKKRKIFVPLDLAHMNRKYPIRKEFLLLELDKVLENYSNFSIQRNVDNDDGNVLDEAENLFGQVIGGLDKLVMNMKKGEAALVTIAPENVFGYVESQHDMIAVAVPSNSVLFYEDELGSFDKKQTSFDMNMKETIQVDGQADVIALKEKRVRLANEMMRESMLVEHDTISNSGYAVSGVLSSSNLGFTSRSECLLELLDQEVQYIVYKLDPRSCAFIDINGGTHDVDLELIAAAKADPIAPFTAALIDEINQSEIRRRTLMLLCFAHFNANVRDAFLLSVDQTGFDIVGKVLSSKLNDCGSVNYQWKEFRIPLKQETHDIGTFCEQLVFLDDHVFLNVVKSCLPSVYRIGKVILHTCYASGSKKDAQWVTKPPPMPPDVFFINALIGACARNDDMEKVLNLMAVFEELREAVSKPRTRAYNALLKGYVKKGSLGDAESVVSEIERCGVALDEHTYSSLVDAYANAGRWESAKIVLREMEASNVRPNSFVYSGILASCRDRGEWQRSFQVLKEIENNRVRPDRHFYNVMIDSFGKYNCLEHAMAAFERMRSERIQPDVVTWNTLIDCHCKFGHHNKAEELFEEMQRSGYLPCITTYNIMINSLGQQERWNDVKTLLGNMQSRGLLANVVIYTTLADNYGKSGRFNDVIECLEVIELSLCLVNKFFMFSLPRPPEADDLEDKVNFKGRGMLRMRILWNFRVEVVF